jgi:hypothetical protein
MVAKLPCVLALAALLALAAPATAQSCAEDIENAGAQLGVAVGDIVNATAECSQGHTAQCVTAIASLATALGNATACINDAVGDCGGASSACVADIASLAQELGGIASEVDKVGSQRRQRLFVCFR